VEVESGVGRVEMEIEGGGVDSFLFLTGKFGQDDYVSCFL